MKNNGLFESIDEAEQYVEFLRQQGIVSRIATRTMYQVATITPEQPRTRPPGNFTERQKNYKSFSKSGGRST